MYDMASPSDNLRLQTEEMTGLPNILHSKLVSSSQMNSQKTSKNKSHPNSQNLIRISKDIQIQIF